MKIYKTFLLLIMILTFVPAYSQPPLDDCSETDNCSPEFEGRRMGRMSKERIDTAMEMLSEQFPEFHGRLENIRTTHPAVFNRTMHKLRMFLRNEGKNPESKEKLIGVFNKEIDLDMLVEKHYNEKDQAKKDEFKSEMKKIMSETFESKEQLKLEIIKKIEKNLEMKKEEHGKRQADKEQIIKNDLERILRMREKEGK